MISEVAKLWLRGWEDNLMRIKGVLRQACLWSSPVSIQKYSSVMWWIFLGKWFLMLNGMGSIWGDETTNIRSRRCFFFHFSWIDSTNFSHVSYHFRIENRFRSFVAVIGFYFPNHRRNEDEDSTVQLPIGVGFRCYCSSSHTRSVSNET